jgi:hypothetical protein
MELDVSHNLRTLSLPCQRFVVRRESHSSAPVSREVAVQLVCDTISNKRVSFLIPSNPATIR